MRSDALLAKRLVCESAKQMTRIGRSNPDEPFFQLSPMARMQSNIIGDIEDAADELGVLPDALILALNPDAPTPEFT